MTSQPHLTVSVVIPVFNEAGNIPSLKRGLDALRLRSGDELLLVDDGSTDGSTELLREYASRRGSQVRLLALPQNRGRSEALNAGVGEVTGDLCAFTDADAQPPADWLDRIRGWFTSPEVVAGGGACTPTNPDEGWVRFYHLGDRVVNEVLKKGLSPNLMSGVNSAVRRSALLTVGGFRPESWWSEDSDLCFRLRRHGRILYDTQTVVSTRYPATLREIVRRKWIWGQAMGLKFRQEGIPDSRLLLRPVLLAGLALIAASWPFLPSARKRMLFQTLLAAMTGSAAFLWIAGQRHLGGSEAALALPLLLLREIAYVAGFFHGLWRGEAVVNRPSWKTPNETPPSQIPGK